MATKNYLETHKKLSKKVQRDAQRMASEMLSEIRLNELRTAMGITQTELAKRLGVSQPAIAGFESGVDIHVSTLVKWAAGMGVSLQISADLPDGRSFPLLGDAVDAAE